MRENQDQLRPDSGVRPDSAISGVSSVSGNKYRPFSAETWSRPGTAGTVLSRPDTAQSVNHNLTIRPDSSRPGSARVHVNRPRKPSHKSTETQIEQIDELDTDVEPQETRKIKRNFADLIDELELNLDDKDYDTDLEDEQVKEEYDHTGRTTYIEACKANGVVPVSYYLRHMNETKLRMKHHGLGASGIKPICISMISNTTVVHLNLTDNWLGPDGGYHVCEMLKENCFIQSLDLSDNRLGPRFATYVPEVLAMNGSLTRLVLSGNSLGDSSALALAEALSVSLHLETLVLSHNSLGIAAGVILGPALAENTALKFLDVSWNHIRRKGAVELAKGIKNNSTLTRVNFSWNGFGVDGATAVADALKKNESLEHIELSNNRITAEGAVIIGRALSLNQKLLTIQIGQNPMQSAGCYAICAAILKNANCKLEYIDFSNILVNADYWDISKTVQERFPTLKIKTGGDGIPKKPKAKLHPMIKLRNFITRHKLRLQDVFAQWDKDNSMSVTRDEFRQGIKELGLVLTDDEMDTVLHQLDQDGDGEINYCELVIGHEEFEKKEEKMNTVISTLKLLARD